MAEPLRRVLVLGGGSAGWLVAARLAAERGPLGLNGLQVTLVESPQQPPIGVGEGSWPTLRETLRRIGLSERELLREADAAFKQGTRFQGWRNGNGSGSGSGSASDHYHHPFTLPHAWGEADTTAAWLRGPRDQPFAQALGLQAELADAGRAPKQAGMPEYAAVQNHGYHLDAGRFAQLLQAHATTRLGVRHVLAHVTRVEQRPDGALAALCTASGERLEADLFIDCSGLAARLIGDTLGVPYVGCADVLPNDRALAVQVPHARPDAPLATQTLATAHAAGWIWDIALPTRRGVGCVFSSRHCSEAQAEAALHAYLERTGAPQPWPVPRLIRFEPGHRQRFWVHNCVAIGLAAGFIEPLEASALALVELSINQLCTDWPAHAALMAPAAERFNTVFAQRWARLIEFLKLHYLLSQRPEPYWQAQRAPEHVPPRLLEQLAFWQQRPPGLSDLPLAEELFPAASYHYVLYGMGFSPADGAGAPSPAALEHARQRLAELPALRRRLLAALPSHRELLQTLRTA